MCAWRDAPVRLSFGWYPTHFLHQNRTERGTDATEPHRKVGIWHDSPCKSSAAFPFRPSRKTQHKHLSIRVHGEAYFLIMFYFVLNTPF